MNPALMILVAGQFEVPVNVCHLPNPVGAECGARVSDYKAHVRWHKTHGEDGHRLICYCKAGAHDYLKSAIAPSTLNCQKHTAQERHGPEKGKRMLSKGAEFREGIRKYRKA